MKRTIILAVLSVMVSAVGALSAGCADCDGNGTYDAIGDACPGHTDKAVNLPTVLPTFLEQ